MSVLSPMPRAAAGLIAGPLAWAIATQGNYALVPWVCAHRTNAILPLALAALGLALVGAWLSWSAPSGPGEAPSRRRVIRFLAPVGAGMGALFALVILAQGAASLILTGCER